MRREFGAVRGARQIAVAAVGQSVTLGEQTMVIPRECRSALRASWNSQVGAALFEELCQRFDKDYPTFIAELRKKRVHYLAFLDYPDAHSPLSVPRPTPSRLLTVNSKRSAATAVATFNPTTL